MGTHPIFESDFDCLTDAKMGKLSVLALALHSTVLGQSNDDEDLTPGASGDYELESSGDQPIQSTTVAATYLLDEDETEMSPLVLYGSIGAGVAVMLAFTVAVIVKYCHPKDTGSYAPGQTKDNLA